MRAQELASLISAVREAEDRAEVMLDGGDADGWTRACGEHHAALVALARALEGAPVVVEALSALEALREAREATAAAMAAGEPYEGHGVRAFRAVERLVELSDALVGK